MMLTYSDVVTFLTAQLEAMSGAPYGAVGDPTFPVFDPGPPIQQKMTVSPNLLVFLSVGGGSGFTTEELYDRPFITIRSLGAQNDFDGAEKLALDLDTILCSVVAPATLGSTRVLYVSRTGARPTLYTFDASQRYQFSSSYITEAKTGF